MISVLNQLIDEREILSRENESLLIETMNEMRKERRLLFKLSSNLTTKHNYDEQVQHAPIPIRFGSNSRIGWNWNWCMPSSLNRSVAKNLFV
ncbi:unnamed protein product [Adineta steineri]|uniref:Uncharacterized protein n=1 Tax=Adineta steineri TaxID=433720 RepID=A0A814CAC3_9BILA|nr:unnamed protein product [Adineta steineri]CAF1362804.1 unnamed protein product [Adineta steineri]